MKALVISGGGSKGAFAGGVAEYLIREEKQDYKILLGTSTGSLLVPSLAIEDIEDIKTAYTSVRQKDIYNVNPFKIKKLKDGGIKTSINHFNILKQFLRGKKSFGEHHNLRKTIKKFFTEDDYHQVVRSDKKVVIAVSNLTTRSIEYKYLRDCTYEDFVDWMWISSSFVPFMSLIEKNGYEYADGGFGKYIPIQQAIDAGATEIDVIVLIPKYSDTQHAKSRNAFDVLLQSMQFMLKQIAYDDIYIGHLESIYNDQVKVRFFFTPRLLTENSFYFDPKQMKVWWQEGFEFAANKIAEYNARTSI